jgi:NADH-quinone oxidoreductase subunit B
MYLPGCPPRPEMLLDAFLKIHDQIQHMKLGAHKKALQTEQEAAALVAAPTIEMKGLLR